MPIFLALAARARGGLTAFAALALLSACSDEPGGGPPPNPSDASSATDVGTTVPDAPGGNPTVDADAASNAFTRGRIASGAEFSCALDESGAVVCWGPRYNSGATPTQMGFTFIAAGGEQICVIDTVGEIICWSSRLGGSGAVARDVPKGPWVEVAIGALSAAEYACARRASGEIACWRSGDLMPRPELTTTPAGVTFNRVATGANAACGIQSDGALRCWGSGLAMNNVPAGSFTDLAMVQIYGCATDASGRPTCWGANVPFFSSFPAGQRSAKLAGSSAGTIMCSVLTTGNIFCVDGGGEYPLPAMNSNLREVAVSGDHYCFVYANRSVGCQSNLSSDVYAPPAGLRVLSR